MPNIIQHKRNSTPGSIPGTGSLAQGELGLNLADGRLYTKNSSNVIINLPVTSISGTSITPASGNFSSSLQVNSVNVSLTGHLHTSSDITNFNSSVSGLVSGVYAPLSGKLNQFASTSSSELFGIISDETGSGLLVFHNSPTLTGVPLAPTAASGTNTNQIASTAFVRTEISNLVASAPSALDTLNELATALGNDANFSTTVTNNLAGKANLSGASFTGSISAPTGNFTVLQQNGVGVSTVGHSHTSSNITDFNSSVSGLVSGVYVPITRTITPGSGLAGSSALDLSADRTIHVGQGDGLTVSADNIAVNSTVIRTTGNQTIAGEKTFTGAVNYFENKIDIGNPNSAGTDRIRIDPGLVGGGSLLTLKITNDGLTQNRTMYFPDSNGTIATNESVVGLLTTDTYANALNNVWFKSLYAGDTDSSPAAVILDSNGIRAFNQSGMGGIVFETIRDVGVNMQGTITIGLLAGEPSYGEAGLNITGKLTVSNGITNHTAAVFRATDNQPPASAFATLDTRNSIAVLDFDDTTKETAVFVGVMSPQTYLPSGLSIRCHWMATTATTGAVRWEVSLERCNTDLDADSFDTVSTGSSTTNGTAGIPTVTSITLTTIDGVTAGDLYRLRVSRDAANGADTMVGDAELLAVEVRSAG